MLVGVADMDTALALFRDTFGLRVERDGPAHPARLALWGVAGAARIVELSCDGYPAGRVQLAAFDPPAAMQVRTHDGPGPHDGAADIGPKAIDFYVEAPIAPWHARVEAMGYRTRSAPVRHRVGETDSEEFVFWGPGGTPLLLMVGHRHTPAQMRAVVNAAGVSEVATVSVISDDAAATRAFYGDQLGLELITAATTGAVDRASANRLTGTPEGTGIQWLLYRGAGEPSGKILVLLFPGAPAKRLDGRMRPGRLGWSLMSLNARGLDALAARLGRAVIAGPAAIGDRRAMLVEGPNGELLELAEPGR